MAEKWEEGTEDEPERISVNRLSREEPQLFSFRVSFQEVACGHGVFLCTWSGCLQVVAKTGTMSSKWPAGTRTFLEEKINGHQISTTFNPNSWSQMKKRFIIFNYLNKKTTMTY